MRVGRIESIGIVLGPTVVQEKTFLPKFVAATQGVVQLINQPGLYCSRLRRNRVDDARKTPQYKSRMEIIGPRLIVIAAISPGTVRALMLTNKARRAHRPFAQTHFTSQ